MTLDPEPLISFEANYAWSNKHKNVSGQVARLYNAWNRTASGKEPARQRWRAGLNALRQIVMDAEQAGKRVRAYGGGWSLSDAAQCPDFLINTKPLNYLSVGLTRQQLAPAFADRAKRMVFAQCGIHMMELHTALEGAGLALPTSGASNGQTFAGAVATGTHGAALQVGAMQDYVRGLHLVTEQGRHVFVEPESSPVVSDAFLETLGAEPKRDDDLFRAALVSFGSFGLVHALVFEAVPLYDLFKYRFRVDHDLALSWFNLDFAAIAAHATLPPAAPYHFEITFNPYKPDGGENGAFVSAMYQLTPAATAPDDASSGGLEAGDDALGVIAAIGDLTAAPISFLVSKLAEAQLSLAAGVRATPGKTFGSTTIRGPVLSAEIGVALADGARAVRALVDEARNASFPGLVAARFVMPSAATLAFTRHQPTTCTIELPGAGAQRSLDFFARVWPRLDQEQIPFTLHWGQCGDWSADRVRSMYGGAVDEWVTQRGKVLSAAGRQRFANAFLERCGLAG